MSRHDFDNSNFLVIQNSHRITKTFQERENHFAKPIIILCSNLQVI